MWLALGKCCKMKWNVVVCTLDERVLVCKHLKGWWYPFHSLCCGNSKMLQIYTLEESGCHAMCMVSN